MKKELKNLLVNGKFEDVTEKTRKNMSLIKGKNNRSTDQKLRMILVKSKISGWKMHNKDIFGKPDFYFSKEKLAIFVDGCYWHGCPLCGHIPKTRSEFWKAKIFNNKRRDTEVNDLLSNSGIRVYRIWEHQLKTKNEVDKIQILLDNMLRGI